MGVQKMSFGKRLKALRTQAFMTQQTLGKSLGVSVVTVRNWESEIKSPAMTSIVAIAGIFGVSTDYLLLGNEMPATDGRGLFPIDRDEQSLILNYRGLDRHGKRIVARLCSLEKERVVETGAVRIADCMSTPQRYLPKYLTPSAAGFSVPLDGDEFEMILADDTVPPEADFAVRIQGESMSPYIHDGDTVYVKRTEELQNGDIGIFSVDGAMYCKQYYLNDSGDLYLLSANEALKNTNVVVKHDTETRVVCFGKVLLTKKVQMPSYYSDQLNP